MGICIASQAILSWEGMAKANKTATIQMTPEQILRDAGGGEYNFVLYGKRYSEREEIDDAILGKRRLDYEDEIKKNPLNYDVWLQYIGLEESCGEGQRLEDVYERAIANPPPAQEKGHWLRYIHLWINYILHEELVSKDVDRVRDIYKLCLKIIPHEKFSFAKIWVMAALFEIRQLNIEGAREILASAIAMAPKEKIFKKYVEIELQLGNIERCIKLYERYAELEELLSEIQPALDMPEILRKAIVNSAISETEYERSRALYERLLNQTKHLKAWISYAKFEASPAMEEVALEESYKKKCIERTRAVFERGHSYFRSCALKEERSMLLEEWLEMERCFGEFGDEDFVKAMLPEKRKRTRHVKTIGCVEYIEYLFPGEMQQNTNLKILEAAYKWKKQKIEKEAAEDCLLRTMVRLSVAEEAKHSN